MDKEKLLKEFGEVSRKHFENEKKRGELNRIQNEKKTACDKDSNQKTLEEYAIAYANWYKFEWDTERRKLVVEFYQLAEKIRSINLEKDH